MARASSKYNPDTYGKAFSLIPEGAHEFVIAFGQECYSKSGTPQWELILHPVDTQYDRERGYKLWIACDGCVEAIFDAAGKDPRSVDPDREYSPDAFVSKKVMAEVWHNEKEGKIYANISRLYPAFSYAGRETPKPAAAPVHELKSEDLPF